MEYTSEFAKVILSNDFLLPLSPNPYWPSGQLMRVFTYSVMTSWDLRLFPSRATLRLARMSWKRRSRKQRSQIIFVRGGMFIVLLRFIMSWWWFSSQGKKTRPPGDRRNDIDKNIFLDPHANCAFINNREYTTNKVRYIGKVRTWNLASRHQLRDNILCCELQSFDPQCRKIIR